MQRRLILGGMAWLAVGGRLRGAAVDERPVRLWIERARTLKSVTADFRQERYLRAVTRPLVTPGRVWFRVDGALRWQLGEPPKTIALRRASGEDFQVIEPAAKTVRSFSAGDSGNQGGALALLDAGFPESYEAFEKRFRIDAVDRADAGRCWRVTAQLRETVSIAVQRLVFVVDEPTSQLRGFEVWLRDGSRIVNEFTNLKENEPVADSVFKEVTDGFRELR